jgi:hypothetical protein
MTVNQNVQNIEVLFITWVCSAISNFYTSWLSEHFNVHISLILLLIHFWAQSDVRFASSQKAFILDDMQLFVEDHVTMKWDF